MKAMQLTRDTVARKLAAYLRHEISLDDLVEWANATMMEDDFEATHYDAIRDAVARFGLADVRAFGLTWEDCARILKQLGYDARVEIVTV
jgi:cobyrinic acid a,c-diamide synthase